MAHSSAHAPRSIAGLLHFAAAIALACVLVDCGAMSAIWAQEPPPAMQYPIAVAATESTVFVADLRLPGVWKIEDSKRTLFFQASKRFRTPLYAVRSLALDAQGRLLAGDSATREVYRFDAAGEPAPLTKGGIGIPMGIAAAAGGEIYVADLELHKIFKIQADGGAAEVFAAVPAPRALTLDTQGRLWVVSDGNNQLLRFNSEAQAETVVEGRPFKYPSAVAVDPNGVAYVCDSYSKAVWKVPAGGAPEKWVQGDSLAHPVGLAWQGTNLLLIDPRANKLFRISPEGALSEMPAE